MNIKIVAVFTFNMVYKIPYRRARAWPSGCIGRVRARAKVSCIQRSIQISFITLFKIKILSFIKSTLKSRSFNHGIRLVSKIMLLGKINLIVFIKSI